MAVQITGIQVSRTDYGETMTSFVILTLSSAEPNRHSINCYAQENAVGKPRNLKKLEHERQLASKKSEGAQFTVRTPPCRDARSDHEGSTR